MLIDIICFAGQLWIPL